VRLPEVGGESSDTRKSGLLSFGVFGVDIAEATTNKRLSNSSAA
jgi:hypothetical protein